MECIDLSLRQTHQRETGSGRHHHTSLQYVTVYAYMYVTVSVYVHIFAIPLDLDALAQLLLTSPARDSWRHAEMIQF